MGQRRLLHKQDNRAIELHSAGALRCLASWALEYAASQDFSAASLNGTPGGRQPASDPVSLLQINHAHLVNAHQVGPAHLSCHAVVLMLTGFVMMPLCIFPGLYQLFWSSYEGLREPYAAIVQICSA